MDILSVKDSAYDIENDLIDRIKDDELWGVEIKFSKVRSHSANQLCQGGFIPIAVLWVCDYYYKIRLEGSLSDKKSVKKIIVSETFIALLVDHEFRIYSLKGAIQETVSTKKYGKLIHVNKNFFVFCKGKILTWISNKGMIQKSRRLTDEEYKYFKMSPYCEIRERPGAIEQCIV